MEQNINGSENVMDNNNVYHTWIDLISDIKAQHFISEHYYQLMIDFLKENQWVFDKKVLSLQETQRFSENI